MSRAGEPEPVEDRVAELVARRDIEGLVALGKALRSGEGETRDLEAAFAAYAAAAELGSRAAEHAVAMFYLTGSGVEADAQEAARRLRLLAGKDYTPAKVVLANLYELGVHTACDHEKADVWYRSAARAAGVSSEPDSKEYTRAMAELGSVRACLVLAHETETSAEERVYFLKKALAYGYRAPEERHAKEPEPQQALIEVPVVAEESLVAPPSPPAFGWRGGALVVAMSAAMGGVGALAWMFWGLVLSSALWMQALVFAAIGALMGAALLGIRRLAT